MYLRVKIVHGQRVPFFLATPRRPDRSKSGGNANCEDTLRHGPGISQNGTRHTLGRVFNAFPAFSCTNALTTLLLSAAPARNSVLSLLSFRIPFKFFGLRSISLRIAAVGPASGFQRPPPIREGFSPAFHHVSISNKLRMGSCLGPQPAGRLTNAPGQCSAGAALPSYVRGAVHCSSWQNRALSTSRSSKPAPTAYNSQYSEQDQGRGATTLHRPNASFNACWLC